MRQRRTLTVLMLAAAAVAAFASPSSAAPGAAAPAGHGVVAPVAAVRPVLNGVDLERATIRDLQAAFRSGRLSSTRLTAFYLGRIRALNPELHAVIATNPAALAEAAAADLRHRLHHTRGPLDGIPILLKDNVDTRQQPATAGSLALVGAPARDAFLVGRLRAAGAVLIGKANLSEWANFRSTNSTSGWSGVGGQTNNPYVLDRNPCGSSSGSGAGIAANLATVAIGSETDGSIVCPSGQNGIVGIKPTLGLVSRTGVVPISAQQDTAGPMARHVVDAALTLEVLRGVDPADAATADSRRFQHVDLTAGLRPGALRGKRIGVWLAGTGGDTNAEVARVMAETVANLQRLGATVVMGTDIPFQDEVNAAEFPALLLEFKHDLNAYMDGRPGRHPATLADLIAFNTAHADRELPFFGQEIFEQAEATSGDETDPAYLAQRQQATGFARRGIDETLANFHLDAIIAPTNSAAWKTTLGQGDAFSVGSSGPAAVSGYPAVTVPAGFSGPLPIGVSFIGPRFGEAKLLPLAFAFEQGTRVRKAPTFIPSIG
jgi:amidase